MIDLRNIGIGLALLGATSVPIIPAGNGLISVAVFGNQSGEVKTVQMSDAQYAKMGEVGGAAFNPTMEGYEFRNAFQYPSNIIQPLAKPSATSSEAQALNDLQNYVDSDNISLFEYLTAPKVAGAAIAFDAAVGATVTGTSLTYAHTVTGTNPYLVTVVWQSNLANITGVTYNGVAMTSLAEETVSSSDNRMYGLAGPATGANNVVVSLGSSVAVASVSASYTGVNQITTPDNTGSGTNPGVATSLTLSITSVADNAWMVSSGGAQREPTAGTGATYRSNANGDNSYKIFDSNGPKTPAGSISMTITFSSCSANCMSMVGVTLAPFVATPVSASQDLIYFSDE